MKTLLSLAAALASLSAPLWAGPQPELAPMLPEPGEPTNLNVFQVDADYVFSSPIRFTGDEIGKGSASHASIEYLRRFHVSGNWYVHAGAHYGRFDFGGSSTEWLPTSLQKLNVPLGLVYIVDNHVGFQLEVRPGFYFENRLAENALDAPVYMGGMVKFIDRKLYGVWGVAVGALGEYPVIPSIGVVWLINDDLRLMGYLPEPKLIYSVTETLSLWVGGQITGGTYRVSERKDPQLSNTVVDYYDFRAGGGITWTPAKFWELNLGGGYSFNRTVDFHRANKSYVADAAPYIRVQLSAEF